MSRAQAILDKSKSLLEEGKFYEYEQKLKTLSSRYYSTGKFDEGNDLLLGGAADLVEKNQIASAYGLINTVLQAFKGSSKELDDPAKKKIILILIKAPWDKSKPALVNKILQWFYPKSPDQDILRFISEDSLKNKEYHTTQRFLLKCDKSVDLAIQMLNEWMQQGNQDERELFIARFVLLKLAFLRIEDAKSIISFYASRINHPLIHFVRLLTKAVEIKSQKAFVALIENYEKTYDVDQSFPVLLGKIGATRFGMGAEKEGSILDTFMKMFSE